MGLERRRPSAIDVIDRVLDKGIVIDYSARVLVLGVDLLTTIEARVVVASFDTYLNYAEAIAKTGLLAGRLVPLAAPTRTSNEPQGGRGTTSRRRLDDDDSKERREIRGKEGSGDFSESSEPGLSKSPQQARGGRPMGKRRRHVRRPGDA